MSIRLAPRASSIIVIQLGSHARHGRGADKARARLRSTESPRSRSPSRVPEAWTNQTLTPDRAPATLAILNSWVPTVARSDTGSVSCWLAGLRSVAEMWRCVVRFVRNGGCVCRSVACDLVGTTLGASLNILSHGDFSQRRLAEL